jgi:hypothetical protein
MFVFDAVVSLRRAVLPNEEHPQHPATHFMISLATGIRARNYHCVATLLGLCYDVQTDSTFAGIGDNRCHCVASTETEKGRILYCRSKKFNTVCVLGDVHFLIIEPYP